LSANHAKKGKLANSRDNAVGEDKNALADLGFPTFEKCPEAPEAIRKQRWLTPTHLK
jgi:Ulp1 protease family, C-terminal catalytic domain